jgi:V/A-type H+-transporting ATPase subunit I
MLAITLGALWAWREGEWKACLTKLGGFLLVLSSVGSFASMTGWISPEWTLYGEGGVLLSLVIIFGFGGIRGAMELHNVVNVLSYLRLMGLGIASAALAFAANKLGGMAGNVFLAIIIGGIFHTINLIFGLFSPTIQSLRLHYVEFFENFFAPGGRPYTPFQTRHE